MDLSLQILVLDIVLDTLKTFQFPVANLALKSGGLAGGHRVTSDRGALIFLPENI